MAERRVRQRAVVRDALTGIEALDGNGQALASWVISIRPLAEPLTGRNLFVLAGGEIFATELQLVSEPVPSSSLQPNTP